MSVFNIILIIFSFSLFGWIPIYFLFDGIAEIIRAFKSGNNTKEKEKNNIE